MLVPEEQAAACQRDDADDLVAIGHPGAGDRRRADRPARAGPAGEDPAVATLAGLSNGAALAMLIDARNLLPGVGDADLPLHPIAQAHRPGGSDGQAKKSLWADIVEGALYIWHRRPLLWLLGTFTVANFVGSPMGVFQPLLVKFNLAANWTALGFQYETALALLGTVAAIGGVAGGLFVSAWGGLKRKRVYGVVVALIIAGMAQVVFGLSPGCISRRPWSSSSMG